MACSAAVIGTFDDRLDELVAEGERGNNHFLLCHARVMQVLLLAYHR